MFNKSLVFLSMVILVMSSCKSSNNSSISTVEDNVLSSDSLTGYELVTFYSGVWSGDCKQLSNDTVVQQKMEFANGKVDRGTGLASFQLKMLKNGNDTIPLTMTGNRESVPVVEGEQDKEMFITSKWTGQSKWDIGVLFEVSQSFLGIDTESIYNYFFSIENDIAGQDFLRFSVKHRSTRTFLSESEIDGEHTLLECKLLKQ